MKISVIIPVYNAEKFLHKCLSTVLNQTFKDYEIILVNDGSKDNSGAICDEYAAKYDFIRAFHKENGGASSARNYGMQFAQGEYINFVDADDWMELDMYEKLVKASEGGVDLVMCNCKRPSDDKGNFNNICYNLPSGYYDRARILEHVYPCLVMQEHMDFNPLIAPWGKLYKRALLVDNKITFDEALRFCEDELFSAIVSEKMQSFYYLKDEYLYIYYYNPNSSVTSFNAKKWEVYIDLYEKMRDRYADNKDYDFTRQLDILIIYLAMNAATNYKASKLGVFRVAAEIRKIFSHHYVRRAFENFKYPQLPKRQTTVLKFAHKNRALLYALLLKR
ncbi:MAG: glycosyltransferase [Clostridia bacterium]|nr:glycosyltransferase [Clostridia bacterium]